MLIPIPFISKPVVVGGGGPTSDFSDNFSSGSISANWTFEANDASGGSNTPTATVANDGTDYWLELSIPDGTDYDTYDGGIDVPVLWQDAADDASFEVAFRLLNSPAATNYAGAGIIISNSDESVFVRIDRSYISGQKIFAARNVAGTGVTQVNVATSDNHVRIVRDGADFDVYTGTGGAWTLRGTVLIPGATPLVIAKVGLYVNSSGGSSGHTAQFDWFENLSNDPKGWTGTEDD